MYAYPHFFLATCEVNRTGECVTLKVSIIDGRYERCLEIYFEFFIYRCSCLTMRSLVFLTKRKMNRTNIWIHAFTNQWMYSIYTERQGRKTADWLPFSWQFVLSADHFTTNQVVYMHVLSGIFF